MAHREDSTGRWAAWAALTLADAGKRREGRWAYGSLSNVDDPQDSTWVSLLSRAGLVLDLLGAEVLVDVMEGGRALDRRLPLAGELRSFHELVEGVNGCVDTLPPGGVALRETADDAL